MADRDGLEGADLHPAAAAVAGAVGGGDVVPGQDGAAFQQGGLVGLDDQQVVGLLWLTRNSAVSAWVCSASAVITAPARSSRPAGLEGGDLAGSAVDLALGEHGAGGVVHRGQQVDLAAVASGASQRLAIDRDCPPPLLLLLGAVAVAKPGADRFGQGLRVQAAQGPADGGSGRNAVVAGGVAAGAERGTDWGGRGGPFGDRGHRAGTGKHRGGGHGQDGDEQVAAATRGTRVGDDAR